MSRTIAWPLGRCSSSTCRPSIPLLPLLAEPTNTAHQQVLMDLKVHVQMSQVCSPVQGRTPTSPPPQHSHMNSDSVKPLYTSSRCPPFFPPGGPGPIPTPPPLQPPPAGTHKSPHSRPGEPGVRPCAGTSPPLPSPLSFMLVQHLPLQVHPPPPPPAPPTPHQQVLIDLHIAVQVRQVCSPVQGCPSSP
jgi:hypothetical protein